MTYQAGFSPEQALANDSVIVDDVAKFPGLRQESSHHLTACELMAHDIPLRPPSADDALPEAEVPEAMARAAESAREAVTGQGDQLGRPPAQAAAAQDEQQTGDPFAGLRELREAIEGLSRRLERMENRLPPLPATPPPLEPPRASPEPVRGPSLAPADLIPSHPGEVPSLAARRSLRAPIPAPLDPETSPPARRTVPPEALAPNQVFPRLKNPLPSVSSKKALWLIPAAAGLVLILRMPVSAGRSARPEGPVGIDQAFHGMAAYVRQEADLLHRDMDAPMAMQARVEHLRALYKEASTEQERQAIEVQLHELLRDHPAAEGRAMAARKALDRLARVSGLAL